MGQFKATCVRLHACVWWVSFPFRLRLRAPVRVRAHARSLCVCVCRPASAGFYDRSGDAKGGPTLLAPRVTLERPPALAADATRFKEFWGYLHRAWFFSSLVLALALFSFAFPILSMTSGCFRK